MKILQEILKSVKRLDDESDDTTSDDQVHLDDIGLDDDTTSDSDSQDGDIDGQALDDLEMPEDPSAEPNADTDSPWGDVGATGGAAAGGDSGDSQVEPEQDQQQEDPETDEKLDDVANQASEDPDRQGVVRAVKGAHLVYKRQCDDGTYEELWIYNITTLQDELTTRRAILAGTDIPVNKAVSPDGQQQYKMWAAGNAEMLAITGLPN